MTSELEQTSSARAFGIRRNGDKWDVTTAYLGNPVDSAVAAMTRISRFSTGLSHVDAIVLCQELEAWYQKQNSK